MRRLFSFIVASVMALSFTNCSVNGYKIEGEVANTKDLVYLVTYEGKMPVVIDSAAVEEGKFLFKGSVDMPAFAAIQQKRDGETIVQFFIENSDITIQGDINDPEGIAIAGSAEQDLYEEGFLTNRYDFLVSKEFVENNPNSVAAAYVLFRHLVYSLPVEVLDNLRNRMSPKIQKTSYIKILDERLDAMRKSAVGQPFMEIALPNPEGEVVSLSSVIDGKNYVLVDFWASWCPPCRAENPHVVAAYNKYSALGFTVYGVSLDRPGDNEKWIEAIKKDELVWTNVSDLNFWNCEPAVRYGVSSIPSNFLISPDGIIVAKNLRGKALEKKLEELLVANKEQ